MCRHRWLQFLAVNSGLAHVVRNSRLGYSAKVMIAPVNCGPKINALGYRSLRVDVRGLMENGGDPDAPEGRSQMKAGLAAAALLFAGIAQADSSAT